jgi:HSP20 family protein
MAKAKVLNQERLAHAVATRGVDTLDDELQAARDAIMRRAYELFEGRGLGGERELDDWLCAERELFWEPQATIVERDGSYVIEIAMPSVKSDELEVQVTEGCVLVKSTCCVSRTCEGGKVHVDELPQGQAFRLFELPARIDRNKATAELRDGLLRITVQTLAAQPARRVPVTA